MLGKYEAKEDRMKQYLEKAKEMLTSFRYFSIHRIPRGENSRADVLSKLAASSTSPPVEEIDPAKVEAVQEWKSPRT
ncbi:reverse transcriptase-like protein, partial [Escherichia coli]|uniref:reverse transcriptase-like protein n=1 Tax=Escherichia coli TaxID=562 RepID=UPI0030798EC6